MIKTKRGLSSEALKIIALLLMIFNHVCIAYSRFLGSDSYIVSEGHWYLTRVSFVIYAFLISEGMIHTHSRKKYLLRLAMFAIISEVPYDLCFQMTPLYIQSQNVFFTLFLGALAICLIDKASGNLPEQILMFLICAVAANWLKTDYEYLGVTVIVSFYIFRGSKQSRLIVTTAVFCVVTYISYFADFLQFQTLPQVMENISQVNYYAFMEMHGVAALPLLALYSGKRHRNNLKHLFYIAYPAHLLIIWCIVKLLSE